MVLTGPSLDCMAGTFQKAVGPLPCGLQRSLSDLLLGMASTPSCPLTADNTPQDHRPDSGEGSPQSHPVPSGRAERMAAAASSPAPRLPLLHSPQPSVGDSTLASALKSFPPEPCPPSPDPSSSSHWSPSLLGPVPAPGHGERKPGPAPVCHQLALYIKQVTLPAWAPLPGR